MDVLVGLRVLEEELRKLDFEVSRPHEGCLEARGEGAVGVDDHPVRFFHSIEVCVSGEGLRVKAVWSRQGAFGSILRLDRLYTVLFWLIVTLIIVPNVGNSVFGVIAVILIGIPFVWIKRYAYSLSKCAQRTLDVLLAKSLPGDMPVS